MHTTAALTVAAAITLAGAPSALAMPAADGAGSLEHLTPVQLRAVDGHQPREPLPSYPQVAAPSGSDDGGVPWGLIAVPAAAFGIAAGALGRRAPSVRLRRRGAVAGA